MRGALSVDVDRDSVHDRLGAAARPVGRAEIEQELRRRVGRTRRRDVAAARREPAADHLHVGVGRLQRVVGLGQERLVGCCGDVLAVRPELRHPEEVEVRLVPDDHVANGGQRLRERGHVRGESGTRLGVRGGRRAELIDREHGLDVLSDRRVDGAAERRQIGRGVAVAPPDRAERDHAQVAVPGEPHLRPGIRGVLRGVLDRADHELRFAAGAAPREGRDEQDHQQTRKQHPHPAGP